MRTKEEKLETIIREALEFLDDNEILDSIDREDLILILEQVDIL